MLALARSLADAALTTVTTVPLLSQPTTLSMQAATCDRLSTADGDLPAQLELQLHKQHELPQILRADEARVRIHASCIDEWDMRVSMTRTQQRSVRSRDP